MKKAFLTLLLLTSLMGYSQTQLYGPTISYQTQSGNMAKVGGFFLRSSGTANVAFKIDATANMGYFRDQFVLVPEVGFTFYPTDFNLILPMIEAEVTPYTFTPKVGFTLLTILDFSLGYGIELNTKKDLKPIKGFTFSLGVNIPINMF